MMIESPAAPHTLVEVLRYFVSPYPVAHNDCVALAQWRLLPDVWSSRDPRFIAIRRLWNVKRSISGGSSRPRSGRSLRTSRLTWGSGSRAVWMVANCKNGISSYEMHRALGVTQKTAWFMDHRIRLAMKTGRF